ncbi:S-adenosyl-L-methionine-dependent methyltransferase [Ophiobolus disseminans]|uniref:S-adenosyl-L-methionine-dependent methyltransferase n=1 Tax=Ophiobolus disseminans TaxID=1469910 RepID=A0A6A7AIZ3_9PLEO|nr:S-adenosyl-L-methionine-dependent methyltransferase [Ophiobolus disseminans]
MTISIDSTTTPSNGKADKNGVHIKNGSTVSENNRAVDIGIAVRACDSEAVPGILKEISSFGTSPPTDLDTTRLELLANARALVRALETPRETMIKHNWAQPGCHTAITTCYNAGVFDVLKGGPMTVDEIAKGVGKNREVLARLLKHISAMGYVQETGSDEYAPTNFSTALTIPIIGDGYPCLAGGALRSGLHFHEYMENTNYATPNAELGPYQDAFDTKMNMFQYMVANPPLGKQFNHHMGGYRQGRPSWMDPTFYPVEKQLFTGFDTSPDAALLVDIGGSLGHDLEEFRTKYPDAPGRLVLQDLPEVIDTIQHLNPKIERMSYDFHTEQPVKAARAYYMHSVLHDWPDEVCKSILKQIVGAMKPGYSKLLINENVIPDKGADWQATALDMMMLTLFSSKERTLNDWHQLLESSEFGLKIVRVWNVQNSQESLIECELA